MSNKIYGFYQSIIDYSIKNDDRLTIEDLLNYESNFIEFEDQFMEWDICPSYQEGII